MNKIEKSERIAHIKSEANSAKSRLICLMSELEEIGAIRDANSLGTIIDRLEHWQNK